MILKFDYMDHSITFDDGYVQVLEIENKNMFYQLVKQLSEVNYGDDIESVHFYDNNYQEYNMNHHIKIIADYFNINFDDKKCITEITKKIDIQDSQKKLINKQIKTLSKSILDLYDNYELPLVLSDEFNLNDIIKYFKLKIKTDNNLLNKLLLLIDINKIFANNTLITLINVKQYLDQEELLELYKYSVYNKVKLLLIDSQCYGVTHKYERKTIIESDLNEITI